MAVTFNINLGIFATPGIPIDFASGDLNGDGFADIVTVNNNNLISIALNNGDGTFRAGGQFQVGSDPSGIIIGNFNNSDRFLDLAVTNSGSSNVSILLGDGAGNFITASTPAVGFSPNGIIQFVGDSFQNYFVTANAGTLGMRNVLSFGLPNGDGTFQVSNRSVNSSSIYNPRDLTPVDIDGDRISEILTIGVDSLGLGNYLILGNNIANFALDLGPSPVAIAADYFNQDAIEDLVVISDDPNNDDISIYLGSPTGAYTKTLGLNVSPAGNSPVIPSDVEAVDFNRDGYVDLVVSLVANPQLAPNNPGSIVVLTGDGNGNFAIDSTFSTGNNSSGAIEIAYLNNDLLPDLIVGGSGSQGRGLLNTTQSPLPELINPILYTASNPDLIQAFGNLPPQLLFNVATRHYIDFGFNEGRAIDSFDEAQYLASHGDLINLFSDRSLGTALEFTIYHYIRSGFSEGRAIDSFDEAQYLASHGDLIAGVANQPLTEALSNATYHYIVFGFSEGRAIDSFDEAKYLASHNDLIAAFANLPLAEALDAATNHYIQFGFSEAREVDTFNPGQYLASHGDLMAAFANLPLAEALNTATNHYIQFGFNEAREVDTFNPGQYLASHGDLMQAFGNQPLNQLLELAANHYIQFGFNEARTLDSFDELQYLASNSDLIEIFNLVQAFENISLPEFLNAVTNHYIEFGFKDGRPLDNFNEAQYLASHGDLIAAVANLPLSEALDAATKHYIEFGFSEERRLDIFNPTAYLNRNPDLLAVFGNDLNAATVHYIQNGFNEGRTVNLTIFVNTLIDENNGISVGGVSLREALSAAQPGDTIAFDPSIRSGTIRLTNGQLNIDRSLTINGSGSNITVDAGGNSRVFYISDRINSNLSTVFIDGLTITGGGGFNLGYGGGIYNEENLTISNSTIRNNSGTGGGGIHNSSFSNSNNLDSVVNVINTTISNNSANAGGGIENSFGILNVINSTISNNSAESSGGGGIWTSYGIVNIVNSTISGNLGDPVFGAGGVNMIGSDTVNVSNSVIAGNINGDISGYYPFTSGGNNLIGNSGDASGFTNGVNGDIVGTALNPIDPLLSPLQNNGGPNLTQIPLSGSPAIDRGSNANLPAGIATDQRGGDRIYNGTVDIGAVETSATQFDPAQYLASHDDLMQAFGSQPYDRLLTDATNHYTQFGANEARALDTFNEIAYLNNNPDLRTALGNDLNAATQHYIQFGANEARIV